MLLLSNLTADRIAELVVIGLKTGEALRLELVCDALRASAGKLPQTTEPKQEGFAAGSSSFADEQEITTRSLSRDKDVNEVVDALLAEGGKLQGLKEILSLAEIRQSTTSRGERSARTALSNFLSGKEEKEKPLLISDFLISNFNFSVHDDEEDIPLNDNSKIVVKKSKKPPVEEYTTELWTAANFRIILHLLKSPVPHHILADYLEYSSVISEYLNLYIQRGVFLLDFEHRHRVAREGRSWTDISSLDEKRFLVFNHANDKVAKKVAHKKSKPKSNRYSKVQLDASGDVICQNYNAQHGCSYDPCRFSHVCSTCGAKHSKSDCGKPQKTRAK